MTILVTLLVLLPGQESSDEDFRQFVDELRQAPADRFPDLLQSSRDRIIALDENQRRLMEESLQIPRGVRSAGIVLNASLGFGIGSMIMGDPAWGGILFATDWLGIILLASAITAALTFDYAALVPDVPALLTVGGIGSGLMLFSRVGGALAAAAFTDPRIQLLRSTLAENTSVTWRSPGSQAGIQLPLVWLKLDFLFLS